MWWERGSRKTAILTIWKSFDNSFAIVHARLVMGLLYTLNAVMG